VALGERPWSEAKKGAGSITKVIAMQGDLERWHLQLQARFDRLRDQLALTASDDERAQLLHDLVVLGDEVVVLLKSRPQWNDRKH
jgi:hypothetical protein